MTYTPPLIMFFSTVALAGVLRLRHGRGKWLALVGVVGLFLVSWPPVDWLFSRPLEGRYRVRHLEALPRPQAIVVLASGVSPPQLERPYPLANQETFERCTFAAWLYRRWQPLPVLACSGESRQNAASATMRELLQQAGVSEAMIWTEERSRSTHENAVYGSEILRMHGIERIALVVDAQSMPRAAACFRKQGVEVLPAPCEFRVFGPRLIDELLPTWKAIRRNERTLHEVVGLAWYRWRGWI